MEEKNKPDTDTVANHLNYIASNCGKILQLIEKWPEKDLQQMIAGEILLMNDCVKNICMMMLIKLNAEEDREKVKNEIEELTKPIIIGDNLKGKENG